jgi:rubrerythrin
MTKFLHKNVQFYTYSKRGGIIMKLKSSKTYTNLARAWASECQARTRYEFVEYGLRYNGFEALAQIVDTIAYQEFNHARMLYTHIQDADPKEIANIDIDAGFPFKEKWDMEENLRLLAEDEKLEAEAYEEFAQVADKEGFTDIAKLFRMIGEVEVRHKKLFINLYEQFKNKELYKKDVEKMWICPNCGYISIDEEAWETCPLCQAEQGVCQVVIPEELRCW